MAAQKIKRQKNFDAGSILFTFTNTGNEFEAKLDELSPDIIKALTLHGLNVKLGDGANVPGNNDPEETMKKIWDNLRDGVFSNRTANGGEKKPTILAEAFQRATERDMAEILERLNTMSVEALKELKSHAQIKSAIKTIKAERAAAEAKVAKKIAAKEEPFDF